MKAQFQAQSVMTSMFAVGLLAGCTIYPDKSWQKDASVRPVCDDCRTELAVLEVSEKGGRFKETGQYERILDWLGKKEHENASIVVYVHGWHHNGACDNPNFLGFRDFLARVERAAGGVHDVLGIYIGWRGDEYSFEWLPSRLDPDLLTIWGRKSASTAVGEGAVRDLLRYLADEHSEQRVFAMGHSLGGSALFHALKEDLDLQVPDDFEYLLINPAAAAGEFSPFIDDSEKRLARIAPLSVPSGDFSAQVYLREYRKITVLQALGDWAVGFGYRLAFIGQTPIGFSRKHATHCAYAGDDGSRCAKLGERLKQAEEENGKKDEKNKSDCVVKLTGTEPELTLVAEVEEHAQCQKKYSSPYWVVKGADTVSKDHSDFFNDPHVTLIASFLARSFGLTLDMEMMAQ